MVLLLPETPVLMASLGVRVRVLPSICADALWLNNTKNSNNQKLGTSAQKTKIQIIQIINVNLVLNSRKDVYNVVSSLVVPILIVIIATMRLLQNLNKTIY